MYDDCGDEMTEAERRVAGRAQDALLHAYIYGGYTLNANGEIRARPGRKQYSGPRQRLAAVAATAHDLLKRHVPYCGTPGQYDCDYAESFLRRSTGRIPTEAETMAAAIGALADCWQKLCNAMGPPPSQASRGCLPPLEMFIDEPPSPAPTKRKEARHETKHRPQRHLARKQARRK